MRRLISNILIPIIWLFSKTYAQFNYLPLQFVDAKIDDVIFLQDTIVRIFSRSKLDCSNICGKNYCVMFTFIKDTASDDNCYVLSTEKSLTSTHTTATGAKTYKLGK